MTINSRAKGRRWQSAVRDWWQANQSATVIEPGGSGLESTDLVVLTTPVVSVEAKNQARMDLAGWVDQAVRQAPAGAVAVVQHKRVGKTDVGESYVTLRACDFLRLVES